MGLRILMLRSLKAQAASVILAGIILLQTSGSWAESRQMAIIAGGNFPRNELMVEEVRAIFLGETQILKSIRVYPIDQSHHRAIRTEFLTHILHMTRDYYLDYWNRRLYRKGGINPLLKDNSREVIDTVQNREGSMGYVWLTEAEKSEKIKILLTVTLEE